MRRYSFVILALAGMIFGLLGATLSAQSTGSTRNAPLFGETLARTVSAEALPVGTTRARVASLNLDTLRQTRQSGQLEVNFFDDAVFSVVGAPMASPRTRDAQTLIWSGTVVNVPYSTVILVEDPSGAFDLRVLLPDAIYTARAGVDGVVSIIEAEPGRGRYDADGLPIEDAIPVEITPEQQAAFEAQLRSAPRADDGSIVDLMVAYTPAAEAMLGGTLQIQLAIQGAVALANQTYINSGVTFQLRLVHVTRTEYQEPLCTPGACVGTVLSHLVTSNDGRMDELYILRDVYAADYVVLVPGTPVANRQYCGIANQPSGPSPFFAYSITEALCISDITLAHEVGHTMGKAHDRANTFSGPGYAYGYQDVRDGTPGDQGDFVTVMAYSTGGQCPGTYVPGVCPAITYWSNPLMLYSGKVLGVATDPVSPPPYTRADNVLSLNQTAFAAANLRVSADGGAGIPTPFPTLTPAPPLVLPVDSLLLNGGFELDADGDDTPDGWTDSAPTQRCVPQDAPLQTSGSCYARLSSSAAVLKQKLTAIEANPGDMLHASLMVSGKNATVSKLILKVVYQNPLIGDNGRGKVSVTMPQGTFGASEALVDLLLLGEITKATLIVRYNGAGGSIAVDDAALEVVAGAGAPFYVRQTQSFQSAGANFPNPERGLFIQRTPLWLNGARQALDPFDLANARVKGITLIRAYYLIDSFREQALDASVMADFSADMATARAGGFKVIPRFAYNFPTNSNYEDSQDAALAQILAHIAQLEPVLAANADVIAHVEAGFVGAWGEWHSSSNNLIDFPDRGMNAASQAILDALLDVLPAERMVALRYPLLKTQMFGANPLDSSQAFNGTAQARIGAHNDCFLASRTDWGTYLDENDSAQVATYKAYLSADNRYVVQSGETCNVGADAQPYLHCDNALNDLALLHWSSLNIDYHQGVLNTWRDEGCYDAIAKRLGYRLRLTEASTPAYIEGGQQIDIQLKVVNSGFASPYNPRGFSLLLRDELGAVTPLGLIESPDPRLWLAGTGVITIDVQAVVPIGLAAGEYELLLHLPDPEPTLTNDPRYAIRLANKAIWDDSTGYHELGLWLEMVE